MVVTKSVREVHAEDYIERRGRFERQRLVVMGERDDRVTDRSKMSESGCDERHNQASNSKRDADFDDRGKLDQLSKCA
jgi:hypothetical protein